MDNLKTVVWLLISSSHQIISSINKWFVNPYLVLSIHKNGLIYLRYKRFDEVQYYFLVGLLTK